MGEMDLENLAMLTDEMPHIQEESVTSALHHDFAFRSKVWSMDVDSLDFARRLDKEDPLRDFRKRFYYPKKRFLSKVGSGTIVNEDEESIYFCGHSLGLQLKNVENHVRDALKNWAQKAVDSHFDGKFPAAFCDLPLKKNMAYLVGAETEEVAIMNALTVNIHIMLSSFYQPTEERHKILMVDNGFHSDLYAVQSHIQLRGYDPDESIIFLKPRPGEHTINPKDIMATIEEEGKEIALVFMEGVHFYTGQLFDMKNITRAAHKQGCVVGFDLAHAVGNVKLQLHDWNVDFALWCTYKYMNCGAGSMAAVFVHNRHTNGTSEVMPMMRGWWGLDNKKKFSLSRIFEPADGADRFKLSNPSPILAAMMMANLEVFKEAGIERIQSKQRLLTGYLEYLLKKNLPEPSNRYKSNKPNIQIITPNNPNKRGCQISLMSSVPIDVFQTLLQKKGIVCDVRRPSVMRVTPVPLYNTFTEVYQFVHTLKEIVENVTWNDDGELR